MEELKGNGYKAKSNYIVYTNKTKRMIELIGLTGATNVLVCPFEKKPLDYPKVKHVIYSPPATIVLWEDGTKTVVKVHDEEYDNEKGLAMAFMRKMFSRSQFDKMVNRATTK